MRAIRRAFKALLLAELIMLIVAVVPTATLWLIVVATAAGSGWWAMLVPGALALLAPPVAFGWGGTDAWGNHREGGGGLYRHLAKADAAAAAEMAKLLEEHAP